MLPVVYVLILILWGELSPQFLKKNLSYKIIGGFLNSRIKDIKNYNNVDILVLGPSGAYRGFDPRIFKENNLQIFNLGSSSQTPVQTEILLNRYINRLKPKMVLYCLYHDMFSENGTESMVDLISNDSLDYDIAEKTINSCNINIINTFIFTFYKRLIDPESNIENRSLTTEDNYIAGGYVEKIKKKSEIPGSFNLIKLKVNKNQLRAFRNVITILEKKQIKIIFIYPPLIEKYYKSFCNKEEINRFFKQLPYVHLNFNISPYNHENNFYDKAHLNSEGVKLFDKEVIETLKRKGII